ncbi:MAG: alpha/beta fold hydrolase [Candidatus Latescibacterota bacterium]|nr:alpha/beta fold hydrolase [Candidatus Latescibacterota bacterium]
MIRPNLLIFALLGLLTAAAARSQEPLRPVGDEAYAVMARWFDYGPTPSALRSDELRDAANGRLYKIVFNGIGARRVPAYLELPLHGEAPYPCVMLVHGMSRSKELWWSFGTTTEGKHKDRLVGEGFAVIGLDLPMHGERAAENDFVNPATLLQIGAESRLRDLFTESVVEHRRAIDALWTRADIDTSRIGVLGYEFGAAVAFALAALEPRVQATVACVPPTVRDVLSVRATQNYAPHITSPFLMLMAANSHTSSQAESEELRALLAASPAELKVYTSDDRLPIWYMGDAVGWFVTHLAQ